MLLNVSIPEARGQRAGSLVQGGRPQGFPGLPPGATRHQLSWPQATESPPASSPGAEPGPGVCPMSGWALGVPLHPG